MNIILTENQFTRLIENHSDREWDSEKLYERELIVKLLKKGPKYMQEHIKKLPHIKVQNEHGDVKIATRIPQTVFQYLTGNF